MTSKHEELTVHLRQFQNNDGSGIVFGYDKEGIDRMMASVLAGQKATLLGELTRYSMWSNGAAQGMDPSPKGQWISFEELQEALVSQQAAASDEGTSAPDTPEAPADSDAKDALRYRWLRDKSEPGTCAFYLSVWQAFKGVKFARETVDEAIDAARAAQIGSAQGDKS